MISSVSNIFYQEHRITTAPGKRDRCPLCKQNSFLIKADDTFGRCFNPDCGKFISSASSDEDAHSGFYKLMEEIFSDFHHALLRQKNDSGKTAYSYLVKERKIHPLVVCNALLGSVPDGYDVQLKFAKLIEQAESLIAAETDARKGKPGRPKKPATLSSQEYLGFLYEAKEKLQKCLEGLEGWLCFFYMDAKYRIVAIHFREPYTKNFLHFKPFKDSAGLFGLELFPPSIIESHPAQNHLIVTEGEFNSLQLQSLFLNHCREIGEKKGYLSVCAVGGVNNADYQAIQQVNPNPVFCYDNDESCIGYTLVSKAQPIMGVTAFTTPETDSDLDSFITAFGEDYESAWEAFEKLWAARKTIQRTFDSVATEIFGIRMAGGKQFEINKRVAQVIINDLRTRGKFYHDGQETYFFIEVEKKLVKIDPDETDFNILIAKYGINRSEQIYKYVIEELRIEAFDRGTESEIYLLAHYDSHNFTVYLFNQENQVYRISPEKIELVDNGTDGVLFLSTSEASPFSASLSLDATSSVLDKYIISKANFSLSLLTPGERRILLTLWFYSLFFESIFPTKPILAFIGPKGSGKSTIQRLIGLLLTGENFDVTPLTDDSKDFDAAVTNSHFVAIDNADSKCRWLNDRLAVVATGGTIKRREYYTTNKLVDFRVRSFLSITSRTPEFHRDDVADRLLIMKLNRFDQSNFVSEKKLKDGLLFNRDKIMSEVVQHIQEIVQALKDMKGKPLVGSFRMADFYEFSYRIALRAGIEGKLCNIFEKLGREQSLFTLENEPIFELLRIWVLTNAAREVTNPELLEEFKKLAEERRINFYYPNPNSFGQRMSHLRPNLEDFYDITERSIGGNRKVYSYKPKRR